MPMSSFAVRSLLLLLTLSPTAASLADDADAAAVVIEFNAAITARDLDRALACLADGGVQMQLQPPHPGLGRSDALTTDLVASWRMVGSILFPATESYERKAEITQVTVSGEVASIWTQTQTRSIRRQATKAAVQEFSELYVLVKKDGSWKIAATAANRPPDDLDLSPSS